MTNTMMRADFTNISADQHSKREIVAADPHPHDDKLASQMQVDADTFAYGNLACRPSTAMGEAQSRH